MTARLATGLLVSALIRTVETRGGHATVLAKGDVTAGAILVVLAEKGRVSGVYERQLTGPQGYRWARVGPQDVEINRESDHYIERRRLSDPDIWVLELDIASGERLIAEFTGDD